MVDAGGFDMLLVDLHIPRVKSGNGGGPQPAVEDIADQQPSMAAGLELIRHCATRRPDAKIVVLTYSNLAGHFFLANQAGADAYLVKDHIDCKNFTQDLMTVAAGGRPFSAPFLEKKVWDAQKSGFAFPYGLTEREVKILTLMCVGAKDKEIAQKLFLAERSVHRAVETIREKLAVENRAQVIALAVREGLVE
ncbi:MAG: response regulator transcription factor [Actinomycetota bacterium]|nr:response regulator transcription factor [Actinomycetota bacterium]MDA8168064.1 response regulator transcription factor [Actinomycetota bacterium]